MNGAKVPTPEKDVSFSAAPASIDNRGSNLAASSKYIHILWGQQLESI